jgi:hypothetical protein
MRPNDISLIFLFVLVLHGNFLILTIDLKPFILKVESYIPKEHPKKKVAT